jgi:hypothetical protein
MQLPALQTLGQAAPEFAQAPFMSQVCGWRFMHCFEPGEQLPAHMPVIVLQTYGQTVPVFPHWPLVSQVWG